VDDAGVLKLMASPLFSSACAGFKVKLVLTRTPATGADCDKTHDLIAMVTVGSCSLMTWCLWIRVNGLKPIRQCNDLGQITSLLGVTLFPGSTVN
jgi:hypothetical protein